MFEGERVETSNPGIESGVGKGSTRYQCMEISHLQEAHFILSNGGGLVICMKKEAWNISVSFEWGAHDRYTGPCSPSNRFSR